MTADATPAAIEALEVARFEIEEVGAIGTMEDGTEVITMGVLLSGDEAAIKWAGKHIFSSVVLMRATDHAALAAERDAARRERDNALALNTALIEANEGLGSAAYLATARAEKAEAEAAALRGEVARVVDAVVAAYERQCELQLQWDAKKSNPASIDLAFVDLTRACVEASDDLQNALAALTSKGGEG